MRVVPVPVSVKAFFTILSGAVDIFIFPPLNVNWTRYSQEDFCRDWSKNVKLNSVSHCFLYLQLNSISRCLISPYKSLLDCNVYNFIYFDWSRSFWIRRWARLFVHGFCSVFFFTLTKQSTGRLGQTHPSPPPSLLNVHLKFFCPRSHCIPEGILIWNTDMHLREDVMGIKYNLLLLTRGRNFMIMLDHT